ncbi:SDR family oxidoreductase [Gephyromycinifex aptenodytis]|uniref:SDR family oxidoreductase n=1 Tax=Gephyromycinifex aptenodytis TaxID=2716227 RepID=UPI0014469CC1|nr:SDR family oxidoreductase [Gephyromycinifex aptenodytis]
MSNLDGKVVVVAGAAGAAGPPLVSRLLEHGATVIALDRDESKVQALTEGAGAQAAGIGVDLLDEQATRELAQRLLAEHGHVDGLMHLVGGWRGGAGIVESDLADWEWLHDLLIRTLQHTSRAFHDALRDSGGRLAIVSTTQAQQPTAKNASYAAAKAAAEAWTLACAHSFRDTDAAAVIVQIKALLTDAMREAKPQAKFAGYTHVEELAERLVGLWDIPAAELNGTRLCLTP